MPRLPQIAIDGPVAAGKSTIAKIVADRLGFTYIDTGAMYRALAWAAKQRGLRADEPERAMALLNEIHIELVPQDGGINRVLLDGIEITGEIRTSEIGQLASELSKYGPIRERMVALQKEMAKEGGVVMEGRDIQTVVMPEAEVKIFLIASAEERATRRCKELKERGLEASYESVLAELRERDHRDSTRAHSPLKAAPEAYHLDSTGLTIEQVAERVIEVVQVKTRS